MGSAVVADNPAAVHGEHDRKILHGDVVHDLIEAALQERRVDRDDRHDALCGEPRGEGHRVLLADADVEESLGEFFEERQQACASGHRRRDRDRVLVGLQDLANRIGEDRGVLGRRRFARATRGDAMPFHVVVLGRSIAVALLRLQVNEDGTVAEVASLLEDALDREEIVTVDWAEVCEAKLLEKKIRDEKSFQAREDPPPGLLCQLPTGHVLEDLTADLFRAAVGLRRAQRFQHPRDRADVRRDAHPIVVKHHDDACAHVANVV